MSVFCSPVSFLLSSLNVYEADTKRLLKVVRSSLKHLHLSLQNVHLRLSVWAYSLTCVPNLKLTLQSVLLLRMKVNKMLL